MSKHPLKPKSKEFEKEEVVVVPEREIDSKKIKVEEIKPSKVSNIIIIIIWIVGGLLALLDLLLGLSKNFYFVGTGIPEKPFMLAFNDISFILIIVEIIVFAVIFFYLFWNAFRTKDYVLKQTYQAFSLFFLCEFLLHTIYYIGIYWDYHFGATNQFSLYTQLYSMYLLQIGKFIFLFYLIDKFVWFKQSKYIGIFFSLVLLPAIYIRHILIHPRFFPANLSFGILMGIPLLAIFIYKLKHKKIIFRFTVSILNICLIAVLLFYFIFYQRLGSALGSSFFTFFTPFLFIVIIIFFFALFRKTTGPIAKNSLKILVAIAIFFYETCVLSSYMIFIIPDALNIYITSLLAITGAIMIAQSKKTFYNLCNTLTQEKICIVHKGKITGKIYICPKCFTNYCDRCYSALKNSKDSCWYCNIKLE